MVKLSERVIKPSSVKLGEERIEDNKISDRFNKTAIEIKIIIKYSEKVA